MRCSANLKVIKIAWFRPNAPCIQMREPYCRDPFYHLEYLKVRVFLLKQLKGHIPLRPSALYCISVNFCPFARWVRFLQIKIIQSHQVSK